MKVRGVITVYLTMMFLLVTALIFTNVESVRCQSVRMLTETAIDSALESLLAEFHWDLLDQYDLFFFDGSFGNAGVSKGKLTAKIQENMRYILQPNYDLLIRNTDFYQTKLEGITIDKLALATDDRGKVFREQAIDYMRAVTGLDLIEKLTNDYNWAVSNLDDSNTFMEKEQENAAALIDLEDDKAAVDADRADEAKTAQSQKNPAADVTAIRSMGILELMYQDTSQISQRSIDSSVQPSRRSLNKGSGLESYEQGLVPDLLFHSYLVKKFPHAASEQKASDGNLQYQLEYLLIGAGHDVDNLKGVINRLLLIREGANFVYLLSDAQKTAEAYAAAMLLVGYTGLVPLIEATKYAILLAWAYAESVLDVKVLLAGEKVALVKSFDTWKTSLANIGELTAMDTSKMSDTYGITYQDYLQMMMLVADKEEITMRALDLIEVQMRHITNKDGFKVDNLIYMLEAEVQMDSHSVFLSLPIMRSYSGESNKKIRAVRRFGYDMW